MKASHILRYFRGNKNSHKFGLEMGVVLFYINFTIFLYYIIGGETCYCGFGKVIMHNNMEMCGNTYHEISEVSTCSGKINEVMTIHVKIFIWELIAHMIFMFIFTVTKSVKRFKEICKEKKHIF